MFDQVIKLAVKAYPTAEGETDVLRLADDIAAITERLDPRVKPYVTFVATSPQTSIEDLANAVGLVAHMETMRANLRADCAIVALREAVDRMQIVDAGGGGP